MCFKLAMLLMSRGVLVIDPLILRVLSFGERRAKAGVVRP